MINVEVFLHRFPRLLRNHHQTYTKLCHDRHRLGRYRGRIGTSLERLKRRRPDFTTGLLSVITTFHVAFLERVDNQLGMLDEEIAPFVLIDAEPFVLDSRESST